MVFSSVGQDFPVPGAPASPRYHIPRRLVTRRQANQDLPTAMSKKNAGEGAIQTPAKLAYSANDLTASSRLS